MKKELKEIIEQAAIAISVFIGLLFIASTLFN